MAEERVEKYNSSGKSYNGEKAIISLTSWKARIGTVSKTLYSLLKMCPGFHIVLVLSEEEFPKKEAELPDSLMLFVKNELIELLWIYKNYKSFKKWIFTADKYENKSIPIISADDDCIYKYNYAQELYNIWSGNKDCIITMSKNNEWKIDNKKIHFSHGCASLYYNIDYKLMIKSLNESILDTNNDDSFYGFFYYFFNKRIIYLNHKHSDYLVFENVGNDLTTSLNKKNQLTKFLNDKIIIYNNLKKNMFYLYV